MEFQKIVEWLDRVLEPEKFDDVSNNGVQIDRRSRDVSLVAFAVDASLASVRNAAAAGAGMLVVHHGISWGGGIKRLTGGTGETVRAAMAADMALYASHLPLDAHGKYGNNALLAAELGLERLEKAFSYHGNVIGLVGFDPSGRKVGVCSGGAGEFAVEAKRLGCELFVTGEASWADTIAAENEGIEMAVKGHYETETYGVRALAEAMRGELGVDTVFIDR